MCVIVLIALENHLAERDETGPCEPQALGRMRGLKRALLGERAPQREASAVPEAPQCLVCRNLEGSGLRAQALQCGEGSRPAVSGGVVRSVRPRALAVSVLPPTRAVARGPRSSQETAVALNQSFAFCSKSILTHFLLYPN